MNEYNSLFEKTMDDIDNMKLKELRNFTKNLLIEFSKINDKHEELQKRYDRNSSDYLSRCTSSGGITIPPRS